MASYQMPSCVREPPGDQPGGHGREGERDQQADEEREGHREGLIAEDLAGHLAARFTFEVESPRTPNRDNTIELQLPFIRHFFGPVPIVPIGVPPSSEALQIADEVVTYARAQNRRIKLVGSTDLTHYGPNYAFTGQGRGDAAVKWVREDNDRRFIDALLA